MNAACKHNSMVLNDTDKPLGRFAWRCADCGYVYGRDSEKRITLHRSGRSWFARFTGPEAERIKSLFSTDDICTGFIAAADPEEVHAKIAQLNPDYLVVINDL
ncbi:hypothetical protein KGP36_02710 [Patescibacteria group bacterium]|nr:hypothetical protein [Patescibacteria group bacterium]